jgi:hypothetical protein
MQHKINILLSAIIISSSLGASEIDQPNEFEDELQSIFRSDGLGLNSREEESHFSGYTLQTIEQHRKDSGGSIPGEINDPFFQGWDEEDASEQEARRSVSSRESVDSLCKPSPEKAHSSLLLERMIKKLKNNKNN